MNWQNCVYHIEQLAIEINWNLKSTLERNEKIKNFISISWSSNWQLPHVYSTFLLFLWTEACFLFLIMISQILLIKLNVTGDNFEWQHKPDPTRIFKYDTIVLLFHEKNSVGRKPRHTKFPAAMRTGRAPFYPLTGRMWNVKRLSKKWIRLILSRWIVGLYKSY